MRWLLLLATGLLSCASSGPSRRTVSPTVEWATATDEEDGDAHEDNCLAPYCAANGECAFFRCEELEPGHVVLAFANSAPVFIAPGSGAQRTWGSAQGLPGDSLPVLVFRVNRYRRELLPSELKRQQAIEEWARRPKERHHIFPQAFAGYFASRGINVHDYVLAIDADTHRRIHKDGDGGPWNTDWAQFWFKWKTRATKPMIFDQASKMIQTYGLFGLTMTYWQSVDLTPYPAPDED